MKKQKSMGNKGFSLVELIIVIAIMAILVGVMAPQLLRYVERTRVSADTQMADSVRTAIRTAMMDPVVLNDDASSTQIASLTTTANTQATAVELTDIGANEFGDAVAETLGVTQATLGDLNDDLQSTPVTGTMVIEFWIVNGNDVAVQITNSDDGSGHLITVGGEAATSPAAP